MVDFAATLRSIVRAFPYGLAIAASGRFFKFLLAFEHIAGLSWPWALLAGSTAFILLGLAIGLVAIAL